MPIQIATDTKPLTKTKKQKSWTYSPIKINPEEITAMRVAVYDNSPDIRPLYEAKRYRAELQIWIKNNVSKKCDYKLVNFFQPYGNFRNNKYKKDDDEHKQWYVNDCNRAQTLNAEYSSQYLVLHTALGSKWQANNFRHIPRFTMSFLASNDNKNWVAEVRIEDSELIFELDNIQTVFDAESRYSFQRIQPEGATDEEDN